MGGKNLKTRQEGMPGLSYYTVIYSNQEAFEATLNRAIAANLKIERMNSSAAFVDVDGIKTKLVLE